MAAPLTAAENFIVPHQEKHEQVIDQRVEAGGVAARQTSAVIASPGATAAELKVAVDAIRAALTASGVTN